MSRGVPPGGAYTYPAGTHGEARPADQTRGPASREARRLSRIVGSGRVVDGVAPVTRRWTSVFSNVDLAHPRSPFCLQRVTREREREREKGEAGEWSEPV